MGKSQFKIAADLVISDMQENGYNKIADSPYYWAYVRFFREINSSFDEEKFVNYIVKRI
jgi:hypothetical protein